MGYACFSARAIFHSPFVRLFCSFAIFPTFYPKERSRSGDSDSIPSQLPSLAGNMTRMQDAAPTARACSGSSNGSKARLSWGMPAHAAEWPSAAGRHAQLARESLRPRLSFLRPEDKVPRAAQVTGRPSVKRGELRRSPSGRRVLGGTPATAASGRAYPKKTITHKSHLRPCFQGRTGVADSGEREKGREKRLCAGRDRQAEGSSVPAVVRGRALEPGAPSHRSGRRPRGSADQLRRRRRRAVLSAGPSNAHHALSARSPRGSGPRA